MKDLSENEIWNRIYCKVVSRTFYPPLRVYDKFSQGWTGEI